MTLVMLICLLGTDTCRTEQVPTEAVMPMQCTAAAFEFIRQHPKYELRRWRCGKREYNI